MTRAVHRRATAPGRTELRAVHHRAASPSRTGPRGMHHRAASPGRTMTRSLHCRAASPDALRASRRTGNNGGTLRALHRRLMQHPHPGSELVGGQLAVLVAVQPVEPGLGIAPSRRCRRVATPRRTVRLGTARGRRLRTARRCGTSGALRSACRSALGASTRGVRSATWCASRVGTASVGTAAWSSRSVRASCLGAPVWATLGIRASCLGPASLGDRRSDGRAESPARRRSAGSWPHWRHRGPEFVQRHNTVSVFVRPFQQLFDEVRRAIRHFVQCHAAIAVSVHPLKHHLRTGRARPFGLSRRHHAAQGEGRTAER